MASIIEFILISASVIITNLLLGGLYPSGNYDAMILIAMLAFAIYKLIYVPLNLVFRPIHEASFGITRLLLIILLSSGFIYIGNKFLNIITITSAKDLILMVVILPLIITLLFAFGYYDSGYDN